MKASFNHRGKISQARLQYRHSFIAAIVIINYAFGIRLQSMYDYGSFGEQGGHIILRKAQHTFIRPCKCDICYNLLQQTSF